MSLTISNRSGRVQNSMMNSRQTAITQSTNQKSPARERTTDRLEWSSSLLSQPERKTVLDLLCPHQEEEKTALESMSDFLSEQMKIQKLCAKIAARIRAGDQVPLKDRRYLRQRNPMQYLMATLMQEHNDNPKRWKTLLKNEDWEKQEPSASKISAEIITAGASAGSSAPAVSSDNSESAQT